MSAFAGGCHDNLSFTSTASEVENLTNKSAVTKLWNLHLLTRGFVTGAGLVSEGEVKFAQKMTENLTVLGYKAFLPRMIRSTICYPSLGRLEVGCSDVNLSYWASTMRVGAAALIHAASQTSLATRLIDEIGETTVSQTDFNSMGIDKETFGLKPCRGTYKSLEIQRLLFGTILSDLEDASNEPMPPHLRRIGEENLEFCDDFERVIERRDGVEILAKRSDWAQKLAVMIKDVAREGDKVKASRKDRAKLLDKAYDMSVLTVNMAGELTCEIPYGEKLSKANTDISTEQLQSARTQPPPTRAAIRVNRAIECKDTHTVINWTILKGQGINSSITLI